MKEYSRPSERRRVPRIPVDFPVTLTVGRKQYRGQACEFSEYGILLTSPNKELVGDEVQVALSLNPNEAPLSVTGMVVYATDSGIGIRFKNVPTEDQLTLRAYAHTRGIGIVENPS